MVVVATTHLSVVKIFDADISPDTALLRRWDWEADTSTLSLEDHQHARSLAKAEWSGVGALASI